MAARDDTVPQPGTTESDAFPAAPVGTLIDGTYRVVGTLGQGAMGVVRLGIDERLDRKVAIKLIQPALLKLGGARKLFRDEARTMARVNHPNVVTIYASGELDGIPYFVMEHVAGKDLDDWVSDRGGPPLPVELAVSVMVKICRGVQAIHDVGAMHGDLKPSNVLVAASGRVAVTDLGLARFLSEHREGAPAEVAGTPEYMAPEILNMRQLAPELALRADVYSLGVIAFELLTGRPPFDGRTVVELLNMHATVPPPPPSHAAPALPDTFDEPILQALHKDPAMRTESAELLRKGLEHAAQDATKSFSGVRIVLLDDDPDFLSLMRAELHSAMPGCQVECFTEPQRAIDTVVAGGVSVAAIDLNMPAMNGIEVVACIRSTQEGPRTPIVSMTGIGGAKDWHVLRRVGADAFMAKPFRGSDLVRELRHLLPHG